MRATARRTANLTHRIEIRQHELLADEPVPDGGDDQGPSPLELLAASLAACTAITMEMYAKRKGWDIGKVEVQAEFELPERGDPTEFKLVVRLPETCSQDQVQRLRVIASKCPVHRVLKGEMTVEDHFESAARATPLSS